MWCVTERADAAVRRHEDGTAGEDPKTGGGPTEYRPHLRYGTNVSP